jgi:hypothetical protein
MSRFADQSRHDLEALGSEVAIECERCGDTKLTHHLEAHPVNQRDSPATRRKEGSHGSSVNRPIDPEDVNSGKNVFHQPANNNRFEAPARQRRCFDNDVVMRNQFVMTEQTLKSRHSRLVVSISSIEKGIQRGAIDENAQVPLRRSSRRGSH